MRLDTLAFILEKGWETEPCSHRGGNRDCSHQSGWKTSRFTENWVEYKERSYLSSEE